MSEREKMMNELCAVSFSLYDVMLYLDTHPDDAAALGCMEEYADKVKELRRAYAGRFGPLFAGDADGGDCWEWVADPWPWDYNGGER